MLNLIKFGLSCALAMSLYQATAVVASDGHDVAIKDQQARTLLIQIGRPDLAKAWRVSGREFWSNSPDCLVDRRVEAYRKLKLVHRGLYRSSYIGLHAEAAKSSKDTCGELGNYIEEAQTVAIFSDSLNTDDVPLQKLFYADKDISNENLLRLSAAIETAKTCVANAGNCSINLEFLGDKESTSKYLNLIDDKYLKIVNLMPSSSYFGKKVVMASFIGDDGYGVSMTLEGASGSIKNVEIGMIEP